MMLKSSIAAAAALSTVNSLGCKWCEDGYCKSAVEVIMSVEGDAWALPFSELDVDNDEDRKRVCEGTQANAEGDMCVFQGGEWPCAPPKFADYLASNEGIEDLMCARFEDEDACDDDDNCAWIGAWIEEEGVDTEVPSCRSKQGAVTHVFCRSLASEDDCEQSSIPTWQLMEEFVESFNSTEDFSWNSTEEFSLISTEESSWESDDEEGLDIDISGEELSGELEYDDGEEFSGEPDDEELSGEPEDEELSGEKAEEASDENALVPSDVELPVVPSDVELPEDDEELLEEVPTDEELPFDEELTGEPDAEEPSDEEVAGEPSDEEQPSEDIDTPITDLANDILKDAAKDGEDEKESEAPKEPVAGTEEDLETDVSAAPAMSVALLLGSTLVLFASSL